MEKMVALKQRRTHVGRCDMTAVMASASGSKQLSVPGATGTSPRTT
jgi:hypothetical protein